MKVGSIRLMGLSAALLLSVTGCTTVPQPCKKVSIPPLPQSVKDEASGSSQTLSEVQQWLQSALRNSDENQKP